MGADPAGAAIFMIYLKIAVLRFPNDPQRAENPTYTAFGALLFVHLHHITSHDEIGACGSRDASTGTTSRALSQIFKILRPPVIKVIAFFD
jgi:hypothetical protein